MGAKIDDNQRQIVMDLRKLGYSVALLSSCGNGIPDILVGLNGENFLFEIKRDQKQKLNPYQVEFFNKWKGQVKLVTTIDEILNEINK